MLMTQNVARTNIEVSSPSGGTIEAKAISLLKNRGVPVHGTCGLIGRFIRFEIEADNGKKSDRQQISGSIVRVEAEHHPNRTGEEYISVKIILLGHEGLLIESSSSYQYGWRYKNKKVQNLIIEE